MDELSRVYGPTITTIVAMLVLVAFMAFGGYMLVLALAGGLEYPVLLLPAMVGLGVPAFLMHVVFGRSVLWLRLRKSGIAGRTLYRRFDLEWSAIEQADREGDPVAGGLLSCSVRGADGTRMEITSGLRAGQMLMFIVHEAWQRGRWPVEEEGQAVFGHVVPVLSRDPQGRFR